MSQARPMVIDVESITCLTAHVATNWVESMRGCRAAARRGCAWGCLALSPAAPRTVNARSVSVRVRRFCRDFPALRAALADDAAEKHRAALAGNAVVVTGYVAANPIPHISPCFERKNDGYREGKESATVWDNR